jgi:hypothetical protein
MSKWFRIKTGLKPEREKPMSKELTLSRLIELSRAVKMTDEEWEEQRRGFVFGNVAIENPNVTREMVDKAAGAIKGR